MFLLIRPCRKPMQIRFDLVIRVVIILCEPIPRLFIKMILFIPHHPNIIIGEKPNHEVHILTAVVNHRLPLIV